MDQAPMQILRWSSWAPDRGGPAGLLLAAFWPNNTVPGAPEGAAAGPRLAAANVPGVNVTVTAHRRSPDEHIKVIGEFQTVFLMARHRTIHTAQHSLSSSFGPLSRSAALPPCLSTVPVSL